MDAATIVQYIDDTFSGVHHMVSSGDSFFIYDPDRNLPPNQQIPFATVISNDLYDQVSNLNRPGVFRVNIGVGKQTFRELLPAEAQFVAGEGVKPTYDYTAFDTFMPHPEYGKMYWVCILNPSPATFENQIKPMLAEAHEQVATKHAKRQNREPK